MLRSRFAFDLLRAVKGGKLIAGEYRFNQPAPATEVYARMIRGDVYTIPVTIPEGYNIFEIAQAVESAGLGSREAFLAAERSQSGLIADLDPQCHLAGGLPLPGHLPLQPPRHAGADGGSDGAPLPPGCGPARPDARRPGNEIARTVMLASLVEKEVSQDCGASAGCRGLQQPAGQEHAAGHRSQRDLRGATGRAVSRRDLRLRPANHPRPTTLIATPDCLRDRSAIPAWPRSRPRSHPRAPTSSTSSPTPRATATFRPR